MRPKLEHFCWKSIPYIWTVVILGGFMFSCIPDIDNGPPACSMVIIVTATLLTLYCTIDDLKKQKNTQQMQIDELKRELESSMNQN